jgi:dephospho-CoA kinase
MLRIALTGGIGCGKSEACRIFQQQHGVPVIDTDVIARQLVQPGEDALQQITHAFGKDILQADGTLNRAALANEVFNSASKRRQLESILHPRIRSAVEQQLKQLDTAYVIVAVPLLIETGQQTDYDRVLVVDCEPSQQLTRTLQRDERSAQQVQSIIDAQASRAQRLQAADDVIDNSKDRQFLQQQIAQLHTKYLQQAQH